MSVLLALQAGGTTYNDSIVEAGSASDAVSAVLIRTAVISEAATATETESAVLVRAASISETATATESESATLTRTASVTETATATEIESALRTTFASLIEAATATDTQDGTVIPAGGTTYNVSITESVNALDLVSATGGQGIPSAGGIDSSGGGGYGDIYGRRIPDTIPADVLRRKREEEEILLM